MKDFYRVPADTPERNAEMFSESRLFAPSELFQKIRPGHGIVLSTWNDGAQVGNVVAFGVVKSVNVPACTAEMAWASSNVILKPNPQGRQFWRNKPFFRFADNVAVRYMLDDLFSEHFPDIDTIVLGGVTGLPTTARDRIYQAIPGYVYVIHSEHGYKIGKTVNIKTRTQMFSVKLPFPIELIHYAWFDNYSEAERRFHERFASKRLEGEWFSLSRSDIEEIRKEGKAVPVEGL